MFKNWVIKTIRKEIKNLIGVESSRGYWSFSFYDGYSVEDRVENSTGLFKNVEKLEEKIRCLEKFLKIEFYEETKEIQGYRPVKASKKKS